MGRAADRQDVSYGHARAQNLIIGITLFSVRLSAPEGGGDKGREQAHVLPWYNISDASLGVDAAERTAISLGGGAGPRGGPVVGWRCVARRVPTDRSVSSIRARGGRGRDMVVALVGVIRRRHRQTLLPAAPPSTQR